MNIKDVLAFAVLLLAVAAFAIMVSFFTVNVEQHTARQLRCESGQQDACEYLEKYPHWWQAI